MKIRIEITKGPDSGREFVLNSNERLVIGRGGEAEIQMTDSLISREHCEIKCDGKRVLLQDLGSTNKTFIVQGNVIEQIVPEKIYPIGNGGSFFAGPESRFTATHILAAPSPPPPSPPKKSSVPHAPSGTRGGASSGNFSNSIENLPGSVLDGDSSISNLLGPNLHTNLDDSVQINTQPPRPAQPSHGYESDSIAPPSQQNPSGQRHREPIPTEDSQAPYQVQPNPPRIEDPPRQYQPSNEDSGIFSRSVEDSQPAPHRPMPPAENYSPPAPVPPPTPQEFEPQSNFHPPSIESQSIVPVHLQGGGPLRDQVEEPVDDEYLKSTPKIDWPKESQSQTPSPTPELPDDSGAFHRESVDRNSIAVPNKIYAPRKPVETEQVENWGAFDSIAPQDQNQFNEPTPASVAPTPAPVTLRLPPEEKGPDNLQKNGLYFHTGKDPAQVAQLIAELSTEAKPLYCIDFTRLEIEPPFSTPLPDSAKDTASDEADQSPLSQSATAPNVSAFDLDDEVEEKAEAESAEQSSVDAPQLIGTPLFDFLPEGHKHNGPILLTQAQLPCPVEDVWGNDAMIIFFGKDPAALQDHLTKLIHTNLQTGKQVKGMFGFCWPTVLHSVFESQGKEQVERVFGDSTSFILLEDPQQRFAWNLVALDDKTGKFQMLKS